MEISGNLKGADIIGSYYFHIKPRPIFTFFGVLLLVLFIWVLTLEPPFKTWKSGLLAVALLYFLTHFFIYLPYKSFSNAKKKEVFKSPWVWDFKKEIINFDAPGITTELTWNHFKKWKQNNKYVLLYDEFNNYSTIPKRWFGSKEQVEQFTSLLDENIEKSI